MLDANDIQIISKIVSDALAEERKHTEAMFAQQRKEIRAEMLAISDEQRKEIRAEMLAISAQQKQEIHADMMTIIESEVNPKLRLLAEGHEALLERMTPPEEIADMEADIVVLKEAVRSLSMKVNALQKAQ
jgi:hypothetical protein